MEDLNVKLEPKTNLNAAVACQALARGVTARIIKSFIAFI